MILEELLIDTSPEVKDVRVFVDGSRLWDCFLEVVLVSLLNTSVLY